jgi:hypothetical protein
MDTLDILRRELDKLNRLSNVRNVDNTYVIDREEIIEFFREYAECCLKALDAQQSLVK